MGKSERTGRYVKQLEGYRAFIPNPLPPEPPVQIGAEMQKLLSVADQSLGRLDGSIKILPNADLFVLMYVRKEAVLSSQIEGTQSSLQDVLAAEAEILNPDRPQDAGEVVNYVRAMDHGLERLKSLPVSVRLIREIHEKLLRGVRGAELRPGEIRNNQNWIGPAGCALGEAVFVPPPPGEVGALLGQLEKFIHGGADLPLLVQIGLIHAQFETIHPFLDGNGRVGRLLISFLLCERGVLLKPVLYLSHYFKRRRQEYYDLLQAVRDRGEWEEWLIFFLRGVVEVSGQATETARKIVDLRERHRALITESFGQSAGNGHKVLESLYKKSIVSVDDVKDLTGSSYQAANALIGKFTRHGILREVTGRSRNRRFGYQSYIALFEEE